MSYVSSYTRCIINYIVHYFGSSAKPYFDDVIHCYDEAELDTDKESDEIKVRYNYLFQLLGSEPLILMLHLALAGYEWQRIGVMIKELTGNGITLRLILDLLRKENIFSSKDYSSGRYIYDELELYRQYQTISDILCKKDNSGSFLDTAFEADRRLYLYVRGSNETVPEYNGIIELYTGEQNYNYFGQQSNIDTLSHYLEGYDIHKSKIYMQLAGESGSGRKSLVKKAADKADFSVVYLDYQRLLARSDESQRDIINSVKRELIFYDAALCIHNIEDDKKQSYKYIDKILYLLENKLRDINKPVIITTITDTEIIPHTELPFTKVSLDCRILAERIEVWKKYSELYNIQIDYEFYGVKYTLVPSQIAKVFLLLSQMSDADNRSLEEKICDCCRQVISMPEKGSIISVNSRQRLSDLKLPADKKEILNAICGYMKNYYKVYKDWNMDSRYSYGKGMTALFTGIPGTGKTMAAGCIAGELGIPLYRVDLSQIVDKYIGETEKKLEVVFKYAQSANVILFFDEADALFGKRSEVKDSKDKYANTEVSYILQRIEQYDGMVILASNFINNIDEAFMRRMKYVVEFQMPDSSIRKEIWKAGFSKEIPVDDIDYDYLADNIELSGGHIKNIIINAAFLAAKDNTAVNMTHILKSTQNEYYKLGKRLSAESFGEYSFCIDDNR